MLLAVLISGSITGFAAAVLGYAAAGLPLWIGVLLYPSAGAAGVVLTACLLALSGPQGPLSRRQTASAPVFQACAFTVAVPPAISACGGLPGTVPSGAASNQTAARWTVASV